MDLGGGALGPYDLLFSVASNASDGFQLERSLVRVCRRDFFFKRATRLERCPGE